MLHTYFLLKLILLMEEVSQIIKKKFTSLAILLQIQEKQILFTYLPYECKQRQFIWEKNKNFE